MEKDRRPPDGKLHPSGDLIGSLRHAQLRAAGCPTISRDVVSEMPLVVGTLIHSWLEKSFRSVPVMNEVNLSAWMPEGWSGTADAFFWNAERRAFVLVDYKSTRPEAIGFIERDGIKQEHLWQASAYWWAAARMGIPLVNGFGVLYLPKNQLRAKDGFVTPSFQEGTPLPQEVVEGQMRDRWELTKTYLASLPFRPGVDDYVRDTLAPVQDRVQKLFLNKSLKVPVWDVKLAPSWSTSYCDFPDRFCDCRHQKTEKVGHWELENGSLFFQPRDGYSISPEVEPDDRQIATLKKALSDS